MQLARRLGLSVANVTLLRLPDPVLVVERFDRQRQAQGVRRLHIIDGCQGLDLPAAYKYEHNFGSGRDVPSARARHAACLPAKCGAWAPLPSRPRPCS